MFYRAIFHHRHFRYLGALYLHSLVRLFAVSIFQIFSAIYVYQLIFTLGFSANKSLALTALFFALVFMVQALATAPALWLISRRGLRFSVFWGNIFLVAFFIWLYFAQFDPIVLVLAAICGGLQVGLYWTAYQMYFTELTDDRSQGKEISLSTSLSTIISIGGPAFGGLVISYGGFGSAFLVMTILVLLANLPLKYLPKQKDIIPIDILATVSALAPKKEEGSYLALLGMGAIDVTAAYFWPLLIFPILGSFAGIGFVGSLMALMAGVVAIIMGILIDKYGARRVLSLASPIDALIWVVKPFVYWPFQVFTVSALQGVSLQSQFISLDALIYKRARHLDIAAFIVQREIGLSLGRFIYLVLVGLLFWFGMPLAGVFIFAAVAALLTRLYPAVLENS